MHDVARKCLTIGITCVVAGALLTAYGMDLYMWIAGVAGFNAEIGMAVVDVVLRLLLFGLLPMGTTLIGAAIVIQTLTSHLDARSTRVATSEDPPA